MKVTIAVGGVEVTLSGIDMDVAQVRALMRHAAGIALAMPRDEPDAVVEIGGGSPIGFTAQLELDPERGKTFEADWYDDEE